MSEVISFSNLNPFNQITNRKVLGLMLFFIGLVILVTPFTPGSILILIGLQMIYGHKIKWSQIWKFLSKKRRL